MPTTVEDDQAAAVAAAAMTGGQVGVALVTSDPVTNITSSYIGGPGLGIGQQIIIAIDLLL